MGFFNSEEEVERIQEYPRLQKQYESLLEKFNKKDSVHSREIEQLRYRQNLEVREVRDDLKRELDVLEHNVKLDLAELESKHAAEVSSLNAKIKTVQLETEEQFTKQVTAAEIRAAKAEALAEGRAEVIEAKDETFDKLKEFTEVIIAKVPEIDFGKGGFNFNIEAPVKVVNTRDCAD